MRCADDTIGIKAIRLTGANRIDVFPDDVSGRIDLQQAATIGFGDQGVAVRQALLTGTDDAFQRMFRDCRA